MAWRIEFTKSAAKNLLALDRSAAARIQKYLRDRIATDEDPCRFGEALVGNLAGLWKYRIGDFRIIAEIQNGTLTVLIVKIGQARLANRKIRRDTLQ